MFTICHTNFLKFSSLLIMIPCNRDSYKSKRVFTLTVKKNGITWAINFDYIP